MMLKRISKVVFVILLLCAFVFPLSLFASNTIPLYRLRDESTGTHFFTSSTDSLRQMIEKGYKKERASDELADSPLFYVFRVQYQGTIPIIQLKSPENEQTMLSTNLNETTDLLKKGRENIGVIGYLYELPVEGASEVFQVCDESTADVVYTTSEREKDFYVNILGWKQKESLGYAQSTSSTGTGRLSLNTIKLDENDLLHLDNHSSLNSYFISDPGFTEADLYFTEMNPKLKTIRAGNVLYCESTPVFPYGMFARVRSITGTRNGIRINVEKAGVTEAFEELHLYVDNKPLLFKQDDVGQATQNDNKRSRTNPVKRLTSRYDFKREAADQSSDSIEMEYVYYEDSRANPTLDSSGSIDVVKWDFNKSVSSFINLTGSLETSINVSLIFDYHIFSTDEFLFSFRPYETANLSITANGSIESKEELKLGSVPATLSLWGIPITAYVDLYAGYEAGASVNASVGVNQSGSLDIGLDFNKSKKDEWNWWCKPDMTFKLNINKPSVSGNIKIYIKPQVGLDLGLSGTLACGVFGNVKTYLDARKESDGFGVYAGLTPGIGAKLKIIGIKEKEIKLEFNKVFEKKLWETGSKLDVFSFLLNNGSPITTSRIVMLNNACTTNPDLFLASESKDFTGASWSSYSTAPSFLLSEGNGYKTVYFKVKKGKEESLIISDSIKLVLSSYSPTLKIDPAIGKQGTVFNYTGSNYSPNGNIEIHVRKPDYTEDPPVELFGKVDGNGNFQYAHSTQCGSMVGTTVVWIIDKKSGKKSNEALETVSLNPNCNTLKIDSIYPQTTKYEQSVTFTLTGTGFQPGFIAKHVNELNQESYITQKTYSSTTLVKLTVLIRSGTQTSTQYIKIINPDGKSSQISFTVLGNTGLSITSVSPNPVTGSNSAQPFTINGIGFVSNPNVTLRDLRTGEIFSNRPITSFSSTRIVINPIFTTFAAYWTVEVINPDGKTTGQYSFQVLSQPAGSPTISSVSPNPVTGSNSAQPFTINGTGFVSNANVTLRDLRTGEVFSNRMASSFSSTRIVINPTFTTVAANWSVEVINPDGKTTGQYSFQVLSQPTGSPTISSVSPNPVTGSNSAQPFTINGAGFISNANVTLRDLRTGEVFSNRTASSFSSTRIVINPTFTTVTANWTVEVINPDGKTTGQYSFKVLSQPTGSPTISSVSPNPVTGSNSAQSFTINGTGFISNANVTLRDLRTGEIFSNRTASSFSSTRIVINPTFTTFAANWTVEVINPDSKTTGQFSFQVLAPPTGDPTISSVSPNPVPGSNSTQTLTIYGSNFTSGCTVQLQDLTYGGTFTKSTTFISSSQIQISANFTNNTATWSARVTNLNGTSSNTFNFTVQAAVTNPTISGVSPNPVPGSNSTQTLTIYGSNFTSGCTVQLQDLTYGGTFTKTTTFISSSQIQISANFTNNTATWSARVTNPNGAGSNTYNFSVQATAVNPNISGVSPNPVPGSNSVQTLTIYGSNFVSGCTVQLQDLTYGGTYTKSTTFISSSQIQISANFTNNTATWSARVTNPSGAGSNTYNFAVQATAVNPNISGVSPNPVPGSNSIQTLTIYGSNFVSGCTVQLQDLTYGGTYIKSTTFISSSQIQISANFTNNTATWSAKVTNPNGLASNTYNFLVQSM